MLPTYLAAKQAADAALEAILTSKHAAWNLRATDRHAGHRSIKSLASRGMGLSEAARGYIEARKWLDRKPTTPDACRIRRNRHAAGLPRISVLNAAQEMPRAQVAAKRSDARVNHPACCR